MNVISVGSRGRAVLGALAILLISASMPAGAIPGGEQLKPVNDHVNVYNEKSPLMGRVGVGFSNAALNVAKVRVSLPDAGSVNGSMGELATKVDTHERVAELLVALGDAAPKDAPAWSEASRGANGGQTGGSYSVDLANKPRPANTPPPSQRPRQLQNAPGGDVDGVLGIGSYYLRSNRTGSYSQMDAVTGWMKAHRFGLASDMGARGLDSRVNGAGAAARVALTVEDFQINLNDIFKDQLVELPLGLTLDIAQQVALPGGETAQKAFQRLLEAEQSLDTLNTAMKQVEGVQADLEPLLSAMPGYSSLAASVTAAQVKVFNSKKAADEAAARIAAEIAVLRQADTAVATANAMYASAVQDLNMVRTHVQALEAQINSVTEQINRLLQEKDLLAVVPGVGVAPPPSNPPAPPVGGGLLGLSKAGSRRVVLPKGRMRAARTMIDVVEELRVANETLAQLARDLTSTQTAQTAQQAAVNAASAAANAAQLARDNATNAVNATQVTVDEANALVAQAQQQLTDAETTKADFAKRAGESSAAVQNRLTDIDSLLATVDPALAEVRVAAVDLAALVPIYEGLTEALQPWPLFKINAISFEIESQATDQGVTHKLRCGLEGVELLGEDLSVNTCEDLADERQFIEDKLQEFLSLFAEVPPLVKLTVPTAVTDNPARTPGVIEGQARLMPLGIKIAPFKVKTLTTPVVDRVNALIDEIQASPAMSEVREAARKQPPPLPSTSWAMDWVRELKESRDRNKMEMYSVGVAPIDGNVRYGAMASSDFNDEMDGMQDTMNEANEGNDLANQGTSGMDNEVGGMRTHVAWEGCENCDPLPPCPPGSTNCPKPPCKPGDPGCSGDPCLPSDPTCTPCPVGNPSCVICPSGKPCAIGDPCLPGPGCVDGRWVGVDGDGNLLGGGNKGSGKGKGVGSDLRALNPNGDLPHTGGRPAMLLVGLVMLMAAGLLKKKPAAVTPPQ